jgi:hypothetical protein
VLPLSGSDESTGFFVEGRPMPEPSQTPHTHQRAVSPDYFKAMAMAIRQGRAFTAQDNAAVDSNNIARLREYGLSVSKRVLGSLTVTGLVTTDKKIGAGLGWSF